MKTNSKLARSVSLFLSVFASLVAYADIELRAGDTIQFSIVEPIQVSIDSYYGYVGPENKTCTSLVITKYALPFTRSIEAGSKYEAKVDQFFIKKVEGSPINIGLFATIETSNSAIEAIYWTFESKRPLLLSDLISAFNNCPRLKYEGFLPGGHEGDSNTH